MKHGGNASHHPVIDYFLIIPCPVVFYSLQHANNFTKHKALLNPYNPNVNESFCLCFVCQAKFKAVMIVSSYHLSAQESNLITLGNAGLWREVRGLLGLRYNQHYIIYIGHMILASEESCGLLCDRVVCVDRAGST